MQPHPAPALSLRARWSRRLRLTLVAVLTAGAGLGGLVVAAPAAVAAAPFACTGTNLYLIRSSGDVLRFDGATGVVNPTPVYTSPAGATGNANQLGITNGGVAAVNTQGTRITEHDRPSNVTTDAAAKGTGSLGTVGAINPTNGFYYYGGYSSTTQLDLYGYDPATNTDLGHVANIAVSPAAPGGNGDIAFDTAGRVYLVGSSNAAANLYVADGSTLPTTTVPTPVSIPSELLTSSTLSGGVNGIAFAADGYLYVANGTTMTQVNPINGAVVASHNLTLNGSTIAAPTSTDLASCAYPSLLTVQKSYPNGRLASGDQVTLGVDGDDYDGTPAGKTGTTTGNETGVQNQQRTEFAGPAVVLPGRSYDIRETTASGTDVNQYVSTYRCVDRVTGNVVASGTGTNGYDGRTGTVTMPTATTGSDVTCTFGNVPPAPALAVDKTVSPTAFTAARQTLTYTFAVTNGGNVPLSDLRVSDPMSGLSAITCSPVAIGGTVPAGGSTTCSATYTTTQDDLDAARRVVNTAGVSAAPPAVYGLPRATASDSATSSATVAPAVDLAKAASPRTVTRAGQVVTYTLTATNSGNQTLAGVSPTDAMDGLSALSCSPAVPATLAPGAAVTCTATYTVTAADISAGGTLTNDASVSAAPPTGPAVTDTASVGVGVSSLPPVATDDTAATPFGTPVTLPGAGNDTAGEPGGPAVVPGSTVFTSPDATNGGKTLVTTEGSWQVAGDGTVTFTPAAGYAGTPDPVQYRVSDEVGKTDTGSLTVTVRPGPVGATDPVTTRQNVTVELSPLGNDTPGRNADGTAGTMDATSVRFPSTGQPVGATVSSDGRTLTVPGQGVYTADATTGVVTFDPEPAFTGPASPVTYTAQDTVVTSTGVQVHNPVRSTIAVTVTPVTPVATDDAASTTFDTPVTLPGATNDTAGTGAPIVIAATVFPATGQPDGSSVEDGGKSLVVPGEGVWRINADGTVTFSPAGGSAGPTSTVTYRVTDSNGTTDTATLDVRVQPGPAPAADPATTGQNVTVELSPLGNDTPGRNTDGTLGTMDATSVRFPSTGQPVGATVSSDGRTLTVPGQGVYTADATTGVVTFDPEPAFTGPASPVTYTAQDTVTGPGGATVHNPASSTIGVTVTPITPLATDDRAQTLPDTPVTLAGATNDVAGAAGAPLVPAATVFPTSGQPQGVTVTDGGKTLTSDGDGVYRIQPDGSIVFTPEPAVAQLLSRVVTYQITDANGTTATATLQVRVGGGVLMAPDFATTPQNVSVPVDVLDNDTPGQNADGSDGTFDATTVVFPVSGQPVGAVVSDGGRTLTVPDEGVYTVDPTTGVVTFDPDPAFTSVASRVTYGVDEVLVDGTGTAVRTQRTSTLVVTVTGIDPVATDDTAATPYGTPVTLPATTNDEAGATSAPLVPANTVFPTTGQPAGAVVTDGGKTLTLDGIGVFTLDPVDGRATFTPAAGHSGITPAVSYRIEDTNGTPDTATLTVNVRRGPVAAPDRTTTAQGVAVTLDPLAGDDRGVGADLPGENADGTPGALEPASVRFPTTGQPTGAVVSDEGLTLTVPGQGVYTIDPTTGRVTFAPAPAFRGTATSVTYTVQDSVLDASGGTVHNTASSTITVTVTGIDPVATDDTASTPYATPVRLPAVRNDTAGAASAPLVPANTVFPTTGQPAGAVVTDGGGTLTLAGTGVFTLSPTTGEATFTPEDGFSGPTPAVTYRIEDTNGTTDTATLTVVVRAAPVARPNTASTPQNVTVTLSPLGNDTPGPAADGTAGTWDVASLVFATTGQPAGSTRSADGRTLTVPGEGVYTIDPDTGVVTVDPDAGFTGTMTPVRYAVTDGNGNTAASTITVEVAGIVPVARPDRTTTPAATPVRIPVLGNDTAGATGTPLVPGSVRLLPDGLPRGSTVTADGKSATIPGQGTFTVGDDGVVTFTPVAGFSGDVATIGYSVADSNGTTTRSTVDVTVGAAGVVRPDSATGPADGGPVTVPVLDNDTPPTGRTWDPSSVCLVPNGVCVKEYTQPGVGTWVVNRDGSITFTPATGYTGSPSIPYSVTDTAGDVYTTTLTVTVPRSPLGALAQTGAELAPYLLTGVGAVLAGMVLVGLARRRRDEGEGDLG